MKQEPKSSIENELKRFRRDIVYFATDRVYKNEEDRTRFMVRLIKILNEVSREFKIHESK